MAPQAFSLEKQFHFYKSYHTNTINKRLHIVFVPVLIVSFLALAAQVPLPAPVTDLSRLLTVLYVVYGIALNAWLGFCFAPFLIAAYLISAALCSYAGAGTAPWAIVLNVTAWVAQFVGHFSFEGRSPALFDSFVNSVLAAPLVIWLEVMFSLGLLLETKARLGRSRVVAKAKKAVKKGDANVCTTN